MKLTLKVVLHIVVYVALVVVWFVAFGDESLRKYNEKAVIVTEHEEYLGYVPQPGVFEYLSIHIYVYLKHVV